jgi:hypothetical protein
MGFPPMSLMPRTYGIEQLKDRHFARHYTAVLIAAPGCEVPPNEQFTVLTDAANEFAIAFRAPGGTVWGARPDAHIGCRSQPCSKETVRGWLRLSIRVD